MDLIIFLIEYVFSVKIVFSCNIEKHYHLFLIRCCFFDDDKGRLGRGFLRDWIVTDETAKVTLGDIGKWCVKSFMVKAVVSKKALLSLLLIRKKIVYNEHRTKSGI